MALSKDFTLDRVRGLLRILADSISEEKIQTLQLDDLIHLSVLDLAELLGEANLPDYGESIIMADVPDSISISGLRADRIVKVVDSVDGLVIEVDSKTFEGLAEIPQKQDNIFFNQFGQTLLLYKGSNTATGTAGLSAFITVFYIRIPTRAVLKTDLMDVSDKFMKLLVDKAKILLYENLKLTPPESLSNSVNSKVNAIRAASLAERKAIEKQ